jgi:Protein of unknown function (DUF3489)
MMTEESQSAADIQAKPVTPRVLKTPPSKTAIVGKLLSRSKGATLAEIGRATNWLPHSCRAFLTGLRTKGATLVKEQRPDGSVAYRIAPTTAVPSA